jgi:hypothetical protein
VACRAAAVATGVGEIVRRPTVVARPQRPPEGLRSAGHTIVQRSTRAGQEVLPTPLQGRTPIAPEAVGHLWHGRAPVRSPIGHERIDGGVDDVPGRWRQRCGAGGGPQAPVPQPCRHDPPRHPPCQERGRLGVSQGMDGGLWGEATLAHHRCERLWEGGGGHRHRPVPGGEPPGARPHVLPGRSSPLQGPFGPWDIAVFAPCALTDPDQQALGVDIRDLSRCPLPEAKPTRVAHPSTQPSVRVLDPGQQGPDLVRTQYGGQVWDTPGSYEVKDGPRALPRPLVEEPDPRERHAAGALGDVLRMKQAEARLAALRFAELVGSTSIVASPLVNRGDITWLSLGGESPQRQVCQPTASECRHRHPPVRVERNPSYRVDSNKTIDRALEPRKRGGKRQVGGTTQKAPAPRFRSTRIRYPKRNGPCIRH